MISLLDSFRSDTTKEHNKVVDAASGMNTRATALGALTKVEKERLTSKTNAHGLAYLCFFRLPLTDI